MTQMPPFTQNNENQTFSLFAQNIVKTTGKKIFSADKALSCLSKSDTFFKELLNLFNKLCFYGILPQIFRKSFESIDTSQTDRNRLELCAKVYEKYIALMNQNNYKIPVFKQQVLNPDISCANIVKNKKYLEFSDIQNESLYIISKIKTAVENGGYSYSDFAVFADKSQARQKFLDLMKTAQIPVTSSIYNEDYENFKRKISVYQKISELKLKLETNLPKSQKEICQEELNLTIKSLMEEISPDSGFSNPIHTKKDLSETDKVKDMATLEYGAINAFYEFYKHNNYAKAIESLMKRFFALFENTDVKDVAAGKLKSLNELQTLYDTVLCEKPDFDSFKEIMEWLPPDKSHDKANKGSVRLGSISTDLKENENFKFVFAAGLTENNFPGNNNSYPFISVQTNELLTKELQKTNPGFDFFIKTDDIHFELKYNELMNITRHAVEEITFSTHSYEAKKTVQPSVFFKALKDNDPKNFEKINVPAQNNTILQSELNFGRLSPPLYEISKTEVVSQNDVLRLNPSAIATFQQCKRKYYFKNLLNLKEESTFAASYGNVVHAVFEVLNRRYLTSYNKETALMLAELLLDAKESEENTNEQNISNLQIKAGFKTTDIELIKATDELSLKEMKENVKEALEDFDMMGYFDNPPEKAVCEKSFSFSIPELPNIIFEGRIDAILTDKEGRNIVIDYKTGKNKINSLEYALSEYGVNFKSKTGKDPSNIEILQNSYDYQIPLYYLACQNSKELEEYKDKISQLGLLYVRPKSKHDGCDDDFVSAEKIEFYKDKIIQNLKEIVIDKIVNETEYRPQKSFNCDNCTYKFLCDTGDEVDDDE